MKNFREQLKKFIIDNLIAMVISIIGLAITSYLMSNQILVNFKPLWFIIFFICFAIFMYNTTILLKIDNLKKRVLKDIENIKKKTSID